MTVTLEVKNVTVRYKKGIIGIENANLKAKGGEIVGFFGADGSGKSSLMKAIAGVQPFEGEIIFNGYTYRDPKEAEKIKLFIGFMPQGIGLILYPRLTVTEHLDFFTDLRGLKRDKEFLAYRERLLRMAGLQSFKNREAGKLSGGMQQKLCLILTLLHKPKMLILDEPTTGVDPLSRLELFQILTELKNQGVLILLASSYLSEADYCDKVLFFEEGRIIAEGKPQEFLKEVEKYTYSKTECRADYCYTFGGRTYSLKPLKVPKEKPTLEGFFIVRALKRGNLKRLALNLERKKQVELPQVVLKGEKITKRFGDFYAVREVDIELRKGEILGLLGPNGAGKTTLIKTLLGLYPIDGGRLELLGRAIKSPDDRLFLKKYMGYMSQKFSYYSDMTVRENMVYFAKIHGLPLGEIKEKIEQFAENLGFKPYLDFFPSELPLGINQRFSLALALFHEPVLVFLDEPTSGVDVIARATFWDLLKELKIKWGLSILVTTHHIEEVEFCDRLLFMDRGRKIYEGKPRELKEEFKNAKSWEEIFVELYRSKLGNF